jgi:hypothetical protein
MHMYMYILELLGGYRQYGKVRDGWCSRGPRKGLRATAYAYRHSRVELQLVVRLGLWIVTTGFSSPSRRSRSGLLAGGIFWCSGIISMASVTADPATELPLLQHCTTVELLLCTVQCATFTGMRDLRESNNLQKRINSGIFTILIPFTTLKQSIKY